MAIDVRRGRCGRVFVTLQGTFDGQAADRLHDVLATATPAPSVTVDFRAVGSVEPLAFALLAGELHVPGRRVAIIGLSLGHRRLLVDFSRQVPN